MSNTVGWPTDGKDYREQILRWAAEEEAYVSNKFDGTEKNAMVDATLRDHYDIDEFWHRQVNQYYDRARVWLTAAFSLRMASDPEAAEKATQLEKMAQQAVAKAMMTAKGFAESMIRVYGPMPKPGVSSGNIEEWV